MEEKNKKQKEEMKKTTEKKEEKVEETAKVETPSEKTNTPKKLEVKTIEKPKKTEAKVGINSAPISTVHSIALCRFIKRKSIEKAIEGLEEVVAKKKALPMKGEYAHKKGMMSGKFPQNSTKYFIKLLKGLQSNANVNEIKNPIIVDAIANLAPRPRGRFGRYQRKRTHITIIVREKKEDKK
jgi:large subunit ribosomal protein L22